MSSAAEKRTNFMRQFRRSTNHEIGEISASQLLTIWNHYDKDRNGYLENEEIELLLSEFVSSVCESDVGEETMLEEMKRDLMDAYDENEDGRIEIRELAQLLPTDENFLLLFQLDNEIDSGVYFMKIWEKYDTDMSGYIEGAELQSFLRDLFEKAKPGYELSRAKLDEYTRTFLELFDENGDGKLQLSEMARMLPTKDSGLSDTLFKSKAGKEMKSVGYHQIEKIFSTYDSDGNGTIEGAELTGFVSDFLALIKPEYEMDDVRQFERLLLSSCDLDGDGKICKEEMTVLIMGLQNFRKKSTSSQ